MNPSGPSAFAMVIVTLSAIDCVRTSPCRCRLFGTQPTPSASAAGTSPVRNGAPLMRIVPDAYAPKPATASATPSRPLLVAPESPTTSPRANGEAHIREIFAAEGVTSSADGRRRVARSVGGVGETEIHLLAGHRLDQRVLGQVGDRRGQDVPGVAQHGDGLADLVDLLQVVRDEEERHALRLQLAHPGEQPLDLVPVELRGRLVENDEPRAIG